MDTRIFNKIRINFRWHKKNRNRLDNDNKQKKHYSGKK